MVTKLTAPALLARKAFSATVRVYMTGGEPSTVCMAFANVCTPWAGSPIA